MSSRQVILTLAVAKPVERDPANGPFLGGAPMPVPDVPVTLVFLILFGLGAFTHNSIYRANAKRGHKFLLSELMFDFCMVRVVTCIFRTIQAFIKPRVVVLLALIFQNGGAIVVFAVNLFLAQRLVRAMHPSIGWHPLFGRVSLFLILSVPAVVVTNIVILCVSFFSVGNPERLQAAEHVLKTGVSWSMMLAVMPLLSVFLASAKPGPPPENFGDGDFRAKATLLVFSASTLAIGSAVRLAALLNPERPEVMSPLFGKRVFYTTGFMLEILTVGAYAFFRIDRLFHVPNGAAGPGDYSPRDGAKLWTAGEIEREIDKLGVSYEILRSRGRTQGPLLAMLYPGFGKGALSPLLQEDGELPRRPSRVSRRKSTMEALMPGRPPRAVRTTQFMTDELMLPPSQRFDKSMVE